MVLLCANCQKLVKVPPNTKCCRCPGCSFKITVEQLQTSPGGQPHVFWRTRCPDNRSQVTTTLSPPVQKPKPTSFPDRSQQKRAVLCGIRYGTKRLKLKGTINDVNMMKSLLIDNFQFPECAICVLTDDQNKPSLVPNRGNIQNALKWLVADSEAGDSLVFFFSGHGLRQPDFDDDEIDGFDETICPSDFMTAGMILDNEINETIVKPFKKGVTLHAIVDACHSGTILDLENVYDMNNEEWVDNRPPSGIKKGTEGGLAISLSACADDGKASDTNAFNGKQITGALTYNFFHIIKENPHITYGNLLSEMRKRIERINGKGCLMRKIFRNRMTQEPLLSSSDMFDVQKEVFQL